MEDKELYLQKLREKILELVSRGTCRSRGIYSELATFIGRHPSPNWRDPRSFLDHQMQQLRKDGFIKYESARGWIRVEGNDD